MQRRMIIRKKFIGVHIGQLTKFIDIFNITDVSGIDLIRGNSGVNAFVMLPFIKTRQKHVITVKKHPGEDNCKHDFFFRQLFFSIEIPNRKPNAKEN